MKNIKIILLAPVVFDRHNNELVEEVMLNIGGKDDNEIFSKKEWKFLDTEDGYLKDVDGLVNIEDALLRERNLNPLIYQNFITPLHTTYEKYPLEINSKLIVNEQHNFLMLFEFNFTKLDFQDCSPFIERVMDNRNLFFTTNTHDYYDKVKDKSLKIINNIVKKILNNNTLLINENNFTMDSNYPLIFINGFSEDESLIHLFAHEENSEQRNTSFLITKEYANSFVHIGWNYGIVKDLPKNLNQKYLCMLIFLQLTYYQLRFYKNYFQKRIQSLSSQKLFQEKEIKNFDKLKILYHKEYLGYKTYKSGLYPKLYSEFNNIEILWHMEEDTSFIEKTFEVQNEYINKHFQLATDKTNRNLNYGIAIIGLVQIFAIYGIFNDYVSLKKETGFSNYVNYATLSIEIIVASIILFVIVMYIKTKVKKGKLIILWNYIFLKIIS
ncbi:MAG: hypothetical protein QM490_02530 [Candidatus Gracilibacteria bacterium]